jgi:hypothetical protein
MREAEETRLEEGSVKQLVRFSDTAIIYDCGCIWYCVLITAAF